MNMVTKNGCRTNFWQLNFLWFFDLENVTLYLINEGSTDISMNYIGGVPVVLTEKKIYCFLLLICGSNSFSQYRNSLGYTVIRMA